MKHEMKIPNACGCGPNCECERCKRTCLNLETLENNIMEDLDEK